MNYKQELVKLVVNPIKERNSVYIIKESGKKSLPIAFKNLKPRETATKDNFLFLTKNILNLIYPEYKPLSENTEYFIVEELPMINQINVYEVEEVISTIKDLKHKEKEDYKVYETPNKVHEITTRIIAKIIRNTLLIGKEEGKFKGIAGFVNKSKEAESLINQALMQHDPIKYVEEEINKIQEEINQIEQDQTAEEPQIENENHSTTTELKHQLKTFEKVKKALEINQKLKTLTLNSKEEVKDFFDILQKEFHTIKELTDNPRLKLANEFKVAVFDPQAGSGTLLDELKEHNAPAILTGSEIRKIKQEKEGYLVSTGTPYEFYFSVLESQGILIEPTIGNNTILKTTSSSGEITPAETRALGYMFYFINPPYDTYSYHVRNTLKYIPEIEELKLISVTKGIPTSPIVIGLLSHKEERILNRYLEAKAIKLKREETGYKEENNPEQFLLFVGFNGNNFEVKDYQSINEFEDEVAKWIVKRYGKDVIINMIADQCNHAIKFAEKTLKIVEEKKELLKDKNFTIEEVLEPISLIEKAKRNEPIFPKLNQITPVGSKVHLASFKEVYSDLELQSLYKESIPELYDLFVKTCIELGKEVPLQVNLNDNSYQDLEEVKETEELTKGEKIKVIIPISNQTETKKETDKEEYIITDLKELGIMRFKYIPQRTKITPEIEEVLKEVINQEEIEKIETIKEKTKETYISLKSMKTSTSKIADNLISTIAVLTISDEKGYDHAIIKVAPEKLFQKLAERKLIDIKAKHISQHPKFKKAYLKLIDKVTKDIINNHEEDIPFILHTLEKYKDLNILTAEYRKRTMLKNQDFIRRIFNLELRYEKVTENFDKISPELEKRIKTVIEKINYLLNKKPMQTALSLIDPPEEFPEIAKVTKGFSIKDFVTLNTNQEVAKEIIEQLYPLAELVKNMGKAIKKLIVAILSSLWIQNLLERREYEKAIEIFENLHYRYKDGFSLRKYQYESALYGVLKAYLTGKPGHFLGWEMRAGKTLTMATAGYFASIMFDRQTVFFVNTNNVFDITGQIVRHLPHVIKQSRVYPTDESDYKEQLLGTTISKKVILNPFFPKYKDMFKAKGNSIENLLKQNPFVKIEKYAQRPDSELEKAIEELPSEIKEMAKIDYPDKNILKGIILYFNEIKNHLIPKNVKKYIEDLKELGRKMKYTKETNERIKIISKQKYGYSFSYQLERDVKILTKNFTSNANVELEVVEKNYPTPKHLENYAIITENSNKESVENYVLENLDNFEEKLKLLAIGRNKKVFIIPVEDYVQIAQQNNKENHSMKTLYSIIENSKKDGNLDLKKLTQNLGFLQDEAVTIYIPGKIAINSLIPKEHQEPKQTIIKTLKGKLTSVHIEYDLEKDKELKIIEGLQSNKSQIVYTFDSINNSIVVTDELDTATNVKSSQLLKLLISIKSPYKMGATGTPTNGYIGDTIGLIGVVSGLPIEIIEKQIEDLNNRYGIKAINEEKAYSLFVIISKYVTALIENRKIQEVINLFNNEIPRNFFIELLETAEANGIKVPQTDLDKAEIILKEILKSDTKDKLLNDRIEKSKWELKTSTLIYKVRSELKDKQITNETSVGSLIIEALEKGLTEIRVLKREVGTMNPMFVKNINDVSGIQFKSREQLKGVKEKLSIKDEIIETLLEQYKRNPQQWFTPDESITYKNTIENSLRYKFDKLFSDQSTSETRKLFKTTLLTAQIIEKLIMKTATNEKELSTVEETEE